MEMFDIVARGCVRSDLMLKCVKAYLKHVCEHLNEVARTPRARCYKLL